MKKESDETKEEKEISNTMLFAIFLIGIIIVAGVWYYNSREVKRIQENYDDLENVLSNTSFGIMNMGRNAKENYTFEGRTLVIRWDPGNTTVVEDNIVRYRQYKNLNVTGKRIRLLLNTEGKGGFFSVMMMEEDGDFWTYYISMADKYSRYVDIDPDEMRLGEWSTGDRKLNKSAIFGIQMEVLADKTNFAEKQTVRVDELGLIW